MARTRTAKPSSRPAPPAHIVQAWGWMRIFDLALGMNGYELAGSFERCADIAKALHAHVRDEGGEVPAGTTTDDIRIALFFEQRSARHSGYYPEEGEAQRYLQILVAELERRHGAAWLEEQLEEAQRRIRG